MHERLNFFLDSSAKFPWLIKHGRIYYATFYVVTGLFLIALALSFLAATGTIVSAIPFATPFAIAFFLDGLLMFFLAATVGKEMTPKSWRTRLKKSALVFTAFLIMLRGWVAASLTAYSFILALMVPFWAAFVILWVAPLIWYLPTEIDEFLALRTRLDDQDKELTDAQKELRRLKVQRLADEAKAAREQKSI